MNEKLYHKIYDITDSERWHLAHKGQLSPFYDKLVLHIHRGHRCYLFDFINTLRQYDIGIVRETRFTEIPLHYHKDMEMSYVYDGHCTFVINGQSVTLTKGDLCIIDTDVINRAKYKGENDIVYNVVFRKAFFSSVFLAQFADKGVLGVFLRDAILSQQATDNYLIFHCEQRAPFRAVFNMMLMEHYFPTNSSSLIIEHYFSVLLLELINLVSDFEGQLDLPQDQQLVLGILKTIEREGSTCRLDTIAAESHFSVSYLYKLLKRVTGKSFSTIKVEKQMKEAQKLLIQGDMPVLEVMNAVGVHNATYFYRKFKELYGLTPKQYRTQCDISHGQIVG